MANSFIFVTENQRWRIKPRNLKEFLQIIAVLTNFLTHGNKKLEKWEPFLQIVAIFLANSLIFVTVNRLWRIKCNKISKDWKKMSANCCDFRQRSFQFRNRKSTLANKTAKFERICCKLLPFLADASEKLEKWKTFLHIVSSLPIFGRRPSPSINDVVETNR